MRVDTKSGDSFNGLFESVPPDIAALFGVDASELIGLSLHEDTATVFLRCEDVRSVYVWEEEPSE